MAENDFLLVYKPPRMHSVPLVKSKEPNILDWCVEKHPEIMDIKGRRAGEGGLLHRLDYETQGLMMIARNNRGMEWFLEEQGEGRIVKEYSALAAESKTVLPGFPDKNLNPDLFRLGVSREKQGNLQIESAFRPYGPGKKEVRPVIKDIHQVEGHEKLYHTEILESVFDSFGFVSVRLRISKGFRHQIRCHLAWLGMPIVNDGIYGGPSYGKGFLGLRACSLTFNDPTFGEIKNYSIPIMEFDDL